MKMNWEDNQSIILCNACISILKLSAGRDKWHANLFQKLYSSIVDLHV